MKTDSPLATLRFLLLISWLNSWAWAQPPTVVQTNPGEVYELKACAGFGDDVWLGGTVQDPSDFSGQPTWTDGFLTRLGPDGQSLWRRRFGGEGGEGVRAVAPLPGGGAVVAGYATTDLALAWAGHPKTDWAREAFLARVGEQGQLTAWLDVRSGRGKVSENYVLLESVGVGADGQIWVGGRFEGSLWGLVSRGPQAFVALFTSDFQLVRAFSPEGYTVTHLLPGVERCLASGLRKGSQEQVVLWNLGSSGAVTQLWEGIPCESAACRQLTAEHMVFAEGQACWELDLLGCTRRSLPQGVWALASWKGCRLALGQSNEVVGDDDVVLWRQESSGWQPGWRLGSQRSDFFPFLVASPGHLTLAGQSRGHPPGQPPGPPDQERAGWIRYFQLPEGADQAGPGSLPQKEGIP